MRHLQSTKNIHSMPGSTQNAIQTATWFPICETHSNSYCEPTRGRRRGGYVIIGRMLEHYMICMSVGRKRLRIICCHTLHGDLFVCRMS